MAFRQPSKNLIANFETSHLRTNLRNGARAVVADLVREAVARDNQSQSTTRTKGGQHTHLSIPF